MCVDTQLGDEAADEIDHAEETLRLEDSGRGGEVDDGRDAVGDDGYAVVLDLESKGLDRVGEEDALAGVDEEAVACENREYLSEDSENFLWRVGVDGEVVGKARDEVSDVGEESSEVLLQGIGAG